MKIKWKFEEEEKTVDEYGSLKSYYKDSEPWRKRIRRPHIFVQFLIIVLAMLICGIVVLMSFNYQGYDWNQSGFRYIKDIVIQKINVYK